MGERRSLGAALDFSPEKLAFINQGQPAPAARVAERPEIPPKKAREEGTDELTLPEPNVPPSARRSRRRKLRPAPVSERDSALLGMANLLVPLTTRLQPVTAAALKRAGLEQKLRGQDPATVQEIAEEALQGWLRDYGYLE